MVAQAWNQAIAEVGGTTTVVSSSVLKKEFGKTMKAIADSLFADADDAAKERLMEKCCLYEHAALEECTQNLLFPDVVQTIRQLAAAYRIFIVSNCQEGYIELFMKKSGLEPYIEDWECFGNTGKGKGNNILQLMQRNGITSAIYVGDTQGDYEATQQAKIPFIFAQYGFGQAEGCERAITSLKELLNL
ncbi:phosphoglycolate phosphatase [Anaerospora hongkongensis]|uniref:Phosphoglycolate phosphatase n=1 Tax=Anaerospora hongkongensis TaxID=244830 RepID=A0A4R1PPY5_9FIRM|nr:phosphoglycolate phosphatase [Anaerospora hongkongensis]